MKTIITIQHTQSLHHTNGMIGSWTDWDLTELGVEQAERIGKNLSAELGCKVDRIISSDLLRARHTAETVAKYFDRNVELDGRLRERNLGEVCGKSVEWAHANTIVWQRTVDDKPFRLCESRRDAWIRLAPFFDELVKSSEKTIIVVSHGDTLSLLNAMWICLDVEDLNRCDLFGLSAGVSFLKETDDGIRRIRKLSDMSYSMA